MAGQYLTAVFEMRPTKRKAAILERARAQAEANFWKFLEDNETEGKEIANEPDAKVRRGRLQEMKKRLARIATMQLHEPSAVGVTRNVVANISSYVGLQQTFLKKGDGTQKPPAVAEGHFAFLYCSCSPKQLSNSRLAWGDLSIFSKFVGDKDGYWMGN